MIEDIYDFIEVIDILDVTGNTIDIEVEDNHQYFLENGILSHNTISMISNTSSGIEPIFAPMYSRRYYQKNVLAEEIVVDSIFRESIKNNGVDYVVGAYDVTPEEHIAVQAAVQDHVDQAISKTINLPIGYDYKLLIPVILDYADRLKGLTLYMAGSRGSEPLTVIPTTPENVAKYIETANDLVIAQECSTGACDI